MKCEALLEKANVENEAGMYLFVCTGNTCRSPMAEAVFNKMKKDTGVSAESCGTCSTGGEMSENARLALESIGISGFTHTSRPVTEELMARAELVIGMTASHAARLMMAFPQFARKITSMPLEIEDPYGGDLEVYKLCLSQICEGIGIGFKSGAENADDEDR